MIVLVLGPWQILIVIMVLLLPIGQFILGYFIGKSVGAKGKQEEPETLGY